MKVKGVNRNIFFLGLTSFFTDISSEMILPLIPLFLENFLGASKFQIGIVEGLATATASLLKVFSGYVSDLVRRKKALVVIGYTLSNFTKPLFAFCRNWIQVLLVKVTDRIGKGIRTAPRDAMISLSTSSSKSGRSFGFHRTMDTLGAVLGVLTAYVILSYLGDNEKTFRMIFLLSIIPGALAVFTLAYFVKEPKEERSTKHIDFSVSLPREFYILLVIETLFSLFAMNYSFMILKTEASGVSLRFLPLSYLIFNIFYVLSTFPMGYIGDVFGKVNALALSHFIAFLSFMLFNLNSEVVSWFAFAIYGIFMAGFEVSSRAMISDIVGENFKGTAYGLFNTCIGIASFLSLSISGFLWDKFGSNVPFTLSSIFSVLCAFLLLMFRGRLPYRV